MTNDKKMKLSELEKIMSGKLFRDGNFSSIGMLYQKKADILCPISDSKYLHFLPANPTVSCLIATEELVEKIPEHIGLWVSPDPISSLFELHNYFLDATNFYGENLNTQKPTSCVISDKAQISEQNIILHECVTIGPFTTISGKTEIGFNSKIANHVVVGGNGFEVKKLQGTPEIIKHAGSVFIGDNVEINPFSTIDRGLFDDQTYIGNNVKMDSYVHIAHNTTILENTIIASSAKIMGSSHIGRNVFISPGVIIDNRVTIGDGCYIGVGEIILNDVPANSSVFKGKILPRPMA